MSKDFDKWLETVEIVVEQGTTANAICAIPALREAYLAGQRKGMDKAVNVLHEMFGLGEGIEQWKEELRLAGADIEESEDL